MQKGLPVTLTEDVQEQRNKFVPGISSYAFDTTKHYIIENKETIDGNKYYRLSGGDVVADDGVHVDIYQILIPETAIKPVHRIYSDEAKQAMVLLPSYKFFPVIPSLKNEHDNSIVSAIEENPMLNKAEVFFWNKQGGTLYFKILANSTKKEIKEIVKEIETTLDVELLEITRTYTFHLKDGREVSAAGKSVWFAFKDTGLNPELINFYECEGKQSQYVNFLGRIKKNFFFQL